MTWFRIMIESDLRDKQKKLKKRQWAINVEEHRKNDGNRNFD